MKFLKIIIISGLIICLNMQNNVFANGNTAADNTNNLSLEEFAKIATFTYPTQKVKILSDSDLYNQFVKTNTLFEQSNITTAYKDFKAILQSKEENDLLYLNLGYQFADMGFFTLSEIALNKIKDEALWKKQIDSIKLIYYPAYNHTAEQEQHLAEIYTDIKYNNLAFEAIKDLAVVDDKVIKLSDYANYLMAQAYFETGNYSKALNCINKSITFNPKNINYQRYKAIILCQDESYTKAVKLINQLLNSNITALKYKQDLEILKEYILAKSSKKDYESKYHLAKYFYLSDDIARSTKALNQSLLRNKKYYLAYDLQGDIYYRNLNLYKAKDAYNKSLNCRKNADALINLGNIAYIEKQYEKSIDYYQKASKKDKKNKNAIINTAFDYAKLTDRQLEKRKIYATLSHYQNDNYLANYAMSILNKDNELQHLRDTISLNPLFMPAWLNMISLELDTGDILLAEKHFNSIKYINESNAKYYNNTISKLKNSIQSAKKNLIKERI